MNRLIAAVLILISLVTHSSANAAVVKTQSIKTLVLKLSPHELDSIVQGQNYRLHDDEGNMRAILRINKVFVGKGVVASILSLHGPVEVNQRFYLEELATVR